MRISVTLGLLLGLMPVSTVAERPADWMMQLTLDGQRLEGRPLFWNEREAYLLGRDGQLWGFRPDEALEFRKSADHFRAYPTSELRSMLLRELGDGYEVSGTTHYMVAHPRGQRNRWPERFEKLYRSFFHYVSVRGFKPSQPPFPLIAIVCKDRADFIRYSDKRGGPIADGILGYYSLQSNRIILYDVGESMAGVDGWQVNASTVIHEATHQTAFNSGIHSRFTVPPIWVVEGLATLFEAPGVFDSGSYRHRSDRINRGRHQAFRQSVLPRHEPELLSSLIAGDRLFETDPSLAYAEAWALTFYLSETQPRQYAAYLAKTADQPPFEEYARSERLADFTQIFGNDWKMLEARFLRFMETVE